MKWLSERMRLYTEALSGIDDMTGEELLQLKPGCNFWRAISLV